MKSNDPPLLPGSVFAAMLVSAQAVVPVPGPARTVTVVVMNEGVIRLIRTCAETGSRIRTTRSIGSDSRIWIHLCGMTII
jgi:hypothetical protein